MVKKKALLIQADTTQTLPMASSLVKLGFEVDAVVSSKLTYGYGSKYVSKKYIFSEYENIDCYYSFILEILKLGEYSIVIPMADQSAILLSKYRDQLRKYSSFVMPDYNTFERGYDKHSLMDLCKKGNFPHPRTVVVDGDRLNEDELKNLHYPVLIKPNHSSGARGITYIERYEDLEQKFPSVYKDYGECHIQEYIPAGGAQIKVQLYVNERGDLIQSSVIDKFRWYPNKGGSSCCNKSVINDRIVGICHKLLKEIGWVGFADFDTIEDPRTGELLIMELNPRVPACVKTAFAAGIDWADVISSEYLGKEHQTYKLEREVYLRHLGFEILWFLHDENRFKTTPSWFKFFGNNIFYQDMSGWSDPKAFLYGTFGNVLKQLSPSFRKTKAGI